MPGRGKKYGVYSPRYGWLVDTCTGGDWSWNVDESVWFDSEQEAEEALNAAEIDTLTVVYPRLR